MFKNLFVLACILLLTNCATSTSAFLGPVFTGAKTGSVYQASLSYGTGKIVNDMMSTEMSIVDRKKLNKPLSKIPFTENNPTSIKKILKKEVDKQVVLMDFLKIFSQLFESFKEKKYEFLDQEYLSFLRVCIHIFSNRRPINFLYIQQSYILKFCWKLLQ